MTRSRTSAKLENVRRVLRCQETAVVGLGGESKVQEVEASRIMSSDSAHYILLKGVDLESSSQEEESLSQDGASLSQDGASLIWDRGTESELDSASMETQGMGTLESAAVGFGGNCRAGEDQSCLLEGVTGPAQSSGGGFMLEEEEEETENNREESSNASVEKGRDSDGGLGFLDAGAKKATPTAEVEEEAESTGGQGKADETAAIELSSGGESSSHDVALPTQFDDTYRRKRGSKSAAIARVTAALAKTKGGTRTEQDIGIPSHGSLTLGPPDDHPQPTRVSEEVIDIATSSESESGSDIGSPQNGGPTASDSTPSLSQSDRPVGGIPLQPGTAKEGGALLADTIADGSPVSVVQRPEVVSEEQGGELGVARGTESLSDTGASISLMPRRETPPMEADAGMGRDEDRSTTGPVVATDAGMELGRVGGAPRGVGKGWTGGREVEALLQLSPSAAQSRLGAESGRLERERTQQARAAASVASHMFQETRVRVHGIAAV